MAKTSTVADHLVERLIEWGVDTIFGFSGGGINGSMESLRTHQHKLRFIQVRHEEAAAAFTGCGYAKYTGRLGACLATSGPNLIGTNYQQDVDLDKLFMDVAAYNQRVMGPAHWVNVVDEDVKTPLTRRTVSDPTIPRDIQEWTKSEVERSSANIKDAESILLQALAHSGPAVIEAVVDPNEPPPPGNITAEQALHLAEALGKSEKDRWKIIKTVLEDKVREVV